MRRISSRLAGEPGRCIRIGVLLQALRKQTVALAWKAHAGVEPFGVDGIVVEGEHSARRGDGGSAEQAAAHRSGWDWWLFSSVFDTALG